MKRTREEIRYEASTLRLAELAKALAHPTRIAILKFLARKSCSCIGDLQALLPLAQSTISQHIRALKEAGLIEGEIDPPKINYAINLAQWHEARALFASLFELEPQEGCARGEK